MEDNSDVIQCSNPQCKIASGGRCVEGLEPEACGNYGKPLRVATEEAETLAQAIQTTILPGAQRLSLEQAGPLLGTKRSRLIAIVGPFSSGKTSLVASIYDQLLRAPIGGFAFQWSHTLHAFEQASHDSRVSSERGKPHSARTPRVGVKFFHLELLDRSGESLNLLLGDRPGEEYRDAGDDTSLAADFAEISRADVITLLLDGKRLTNDARRHNTRQDVLLILQALKDEGMFNPSARLAVVLTKLDAVRASPKAERVEADFENAVATYKELFSECFADIEVFRVAASPTKLGVTRGAGIVELLGYWLADIPTARLKQPAAAVSKPERAISRLVEIGPNA